jgi:hypothetical protein
MNISMEKPTLPAARQFADDIRALYAKGLEQVEAKASQTGRSVVTGSSAYADDDDDVIGRGSNAVR